MAMQRITTPRATIIAKKHRIVKDDGTVIYGSCRLEWNQDFAARRNEQFTRAQRFVDTEVLRLCSPRVPFDTGMLEKSGTLGTTVGSGEVSYIAPYASFQYYSTSESRSYDPQRGAKWFERMKSSCRDDILRGAQKFIK